MAITRPVPKTDRLGLLICDRLGLDPEHVVSGSIVVRPHDDDPDQAVVTWQGVQFMPLDEVNQVLAEHQAVRP